MNYTPILDNLLIMFMLLPCLVLTWWGLIRLVNRSMGFDMRKVYERIYSDPMAAAVMRVGLIGSVAYLVGEAFGRII